MVVPVAARWVATAFGILLVLAGWQSVIGTLIVPRPVGSWLTRWVDRLVLATYRAVTMPVTDYVRRDRILATQAAAILVTQLAAWLGIFLVGFTLTLWPAHGRSITAALADAGSSIFTLGFAEPPGTTPAVVVFIAAAGLCSALALANAPVGPSSYSPALTGLRPLVANDSTVVLASPELLEDDHGTNYIAWELRGGRVCIEADTAHRG